jgi:hypothetical protein
MKKCYDGVKKIKMKLIQKSRKIQKKTKKQKSLLNIKELVGF